ncbi:MAG: acetylornithine carbamoyltransferase [Bacteroidetes bacterium]|nr:acetylornithine carbamoyltransferase [Bacteroidota bacterium]
MKQFLSVADVSSIPQLVEEALEMKNGHVQFNEFGQGLKLGMVFLNPSLRTRLSTEMAAKNLGMEVQVLNMGSDTWGLEFGEGAVMNQDKPEHVKEAAGVIGRYFDIVGLRSFPGLMSKVEDDAETVFRSFGKYVDKPLLSMESATRHPLQSLADLITIAEHSKKKRPKIALTWAPHVKALPQAVPHSFAEWMLATGHELHIAHPAGLELDPSFTDGAFITHNQQEALEDADFIYVKNWSMREPYGKTYNGGGEWMLREDSLKGASEAKIMHCLPVRRNIELSDELLDSPRSMVLNQAENRLWSAQVVLKKMIESIHEKRKETVGH